MNITRVFPALAACAALALICLTPTRAQEPPGESSVEAAGSPATPVAPLAEDASQTKPLREQSIYIPYAKLRAVFEKEGRGVFLPYDEFQELWRQARSKHAPDIDQQPPVDVLLTDAENEATVEKDVVLVRARLQIELLGRGWHEIPLRLKDAAIRSARIGDEPARVVFDAKVGYKLLVKSDSDESTRLELALEYAKAFSKAPGQNSVSFQAPQAPVNRWRIRIPQAGVKVNVHPLIAATEVVDETGGGETESAEDAAPADVGEDEAGAAEDDAGEPAADDIEPPAASVAEETIILAFVGAAPEVRIDWTPKAEGAAGLEALASVQAEQEVSVEEGVVRTRVRLAYQISRAELSQLTIEVPSDQKVTGVFDPNVRQWEIDSAADKQTIRVQLFEATRGSQNVTVELERFLDVITMRELSAPVVRAIGVGRQQGVVVVRLGDELKAQATRRHGLAQLDAAELPATLKQGQWPFAYRYAALPFELVLGVEKVQPQIRTDELVEAYLEPQQLTYHLLALADVQRAGVFQLEFEIPAGFEVRQARGQAAAGAEAASVDTYHLEGDDKTRLKVNLAHKAMGRVGLLVELHKPLAEANLLAPTGQSSEILLPLPRVATEVEQAKGRVILYAPESLRVNPRRQVGLRDISFSEALQGVQSLRGDRFAGLRQVMALAYAQAPVELALDVERRRPYVTARQLLTAGVESGVTNYEATFFFDVQYSAVKMLRIDFPAEMADEVPNQESSLREAKMDPQPEDVAEGYEAWSFTGAEELLGSSTIRLAWEHKTSELEIGKSADYVLPVLQPRQVDRAWGQIVVTKAEALDVRPQEGLSGLRPIDPQHDLMGGAQVEDAARAFEFHDEWSLTLTATRYELEDVKRTSIERAVLRMVVTRSNRVTVQALYRMRSAVQRLAIELPVVGAGDADAQVQFDSNPLRINGQPVALEKGDQGEFYVPLVGQNPDQAFLLELRYTVPGSFSQLDFPTFPDQPPVQSKPAVQKVTLCVYLPEEMALISVRGPWTSEQGNWFERRVLGVRDATDDTSQIQWVTADIQLPNDPDESFHTDGELYLFTTLQPEEPPDGSLRLTAVRRSWLNTVVFGALAIVGLVFVRTPAVVKLVVLALIVIALVLTGVFAAPLAVCVINLQLFVAIGLVVLVWGGLALVLPRRPPDATVPPVEPEEFPIELRESYLSNTPLESLTPMDEADQERSPLAIDEDSDTEDGDVEGTGGDAEDRPSDAESDDREDSQDKGGPDNA